MNLAFMDETVEVPFTGEETPLMLAAIIVGFIVLPWLSANVIKWEATKSQKVLWTSTLSIATALLMDFVAGGSITVESLLTTILAVVGGSELGYRKVWKPLRNEDVGQPVVGALAKLEHFGVGSGGGVVEAD